MSFSGPNISAVPFGTEITFNCTSHARPDVQEYWFYKGKETLGSSETGVFRFVIKEPGSYSCAPVNSVGNGKEAAISIGVDGRCRVLNSFSVIWFILKQELYSPRVWCPFLERPGNFSGPKSNFKSKTC